MITPRLTEERLFEIAYVYEQATKFGEKLAHSFED
jgi:hypothetical protein